MSIILADVLYSTIIHLTKGRVQYFSMQVVMNKCFLLNSGKKWRRSLFIVFEINAKSALFNFEK